jgi:hypothetical protein
LIWLHDIARVVAAVPELDWDHVAATSARLRLMTPVGLALRAAARWVGAEVSEEILARFEPRSSSTLDRWDHSRLAALVASIGERDLSAEELAVSPIGPALSRLSGWGPRLRVLRWVALPCRAYLADRGISPSGPFGYVGASVERYVRHLVGRPAQLTSDRTSAAAADKSPERSL